MAAENKTQRSIAAELGVPYRSFEAMLNKEKGHNDLRLAWERGHAAVEQKIADFLLKSATGASKGAVIAAVFFAKARLGWSDKEAPANVQNNININLPKPMSRDEYFKSLGISGPIDSRMKDVTPSKAALPAPSDIAPAEVPK